MPVLELVFETHSLTTDNELGIATGWLPGRLSEEGRKQAARLGDRRRDIAVVFASDLQRAVDTVGIAFGETSIPVFLDRRLRECDYGELNGAPVAQLDRRRHVDEPFPGGESYRDVVARTASLLRELLTQWDGARVCVVAHSANRWALEHLVHGAPLEQLVEAPFAWREGWEFAIERI